MPKVKDRVGGNLAFKIKCVRKNSHSSTKIRLLREIINLPIRALPVFKKFIHHIADPQVRLVWIKRVASVLGILTVGICALLIISIAALNFVVVPNIAIWRADLERISSKYLGNQVHIGEIEVNTQKIIPSFEFKKVSIQALNEAGQLETLTLPAIKLEISLQSLLRLSIEAIDFETPQIVAIKNASGSIRVAGLAKLAKNDSSSLDWMFSQPKIRIHNATVQLFDEQSQENPILFTSVNVQIENGLKSHTVALDAIPPEDFGEGFQVQAHFKEALLSNSVADFSAWSGVTQLNFPNFDVSKIIKYFPHQNWNIQTAKGKSQLWLDVYRGEINQLTAEINFPIIETSWITKKNSEKTYLLKDVNGKIEMNWRGAAHEIKVENMNALSQDGTQWKLGHALYSWNPLALTPQHNSNLKDESKTLLSAKTDTEASSEESGTAVLEVDNIPIKPLIDQVNVTETDSNLINQLKEIELGGNLKNFKAKWISNDQNIDSYSSSGELSEFSFDRLNERGEEFLKGIPEIQNANIQFEMNQSGGSAKVSVENGGIKLRRWLDEPNVLLSKATARVLWERDDASFNFKIENANIINPDAKGSFDLNCSIPRETNANGTKLQIDNSFIDLNISIQEGSAAQVYRYLPNTVNADLRQYLQNAILHGSISNGSVKIKGRIDKFPFHNPKDGEFQISAQGEDVTYQYAPKDSAEIKGNELNKPWPELTHMNAQLNINRTRLMIRKGAAKLNIATKASLDWPFLSAEIPDLLKPTIQVSAVGKGPLADAIKLINNSAISEIIDDSLNAAQSSSTGNAEYSLNLNLPLSDLKKSKVSGKISFVNNDLSLVPSLPDLNKLRGDLRFNESGFNVSGLRAKVLGSDVKIDGGLRFVGDKVEPATLKIQGIFAPDTLRQNRDYLEIAKVGQYLKGQTNYEATFSYKKGQLDFDLTSNLVGLVSKFPEPFAKTADTSLPIKLNMSLTPQLPGEERSNLVAQTQRKQIKTTASIGQIALINLKTEFATADKSLVNQGSNPSINQSSLSGNNATTQFFKTDIKGSIAINANGVQNVQTPSDTGLLLSIDVPRLNADAWEAVGSQLFGEAEMGMNPKKDGSTQIPTQTLIRRDSGNSKISVFKLIPNLIKIRTDELTIFRRPIHQVVLDATYQDSEPSGQWHVNIKSPQAKGVIDYRVSSGGATAKVFARMDYLMIPPAAIDSVESLLTEDEKVMPSLDLVIDDLEIKGKKLGRAEILAVNQSLSDGTKEWRINKLNLTVAEAKFQANGVWALVWDTKRIKNIKKTSLDFTLDIDNAGLLLERLGTKGAVLAGKGRLNGQINWQGSPLQIDYPSMGGRFYVNVEKGSFLKTEPGAGRLLGVLNLQALPRRLLLDFKDIFSDGLSFDFFKGDVTIDMGIAKTNNLQMKSVNTAVLMEGRADIDKETQNLKVVVIPEIDAGTASLVVAAINPVVGISTYLAQYFLKKPLAQVTTKDFLVEGTWSDPKVTRIELKGEEKTNTARDVKGE